MALDHSMVRWHEAAKTRFSVRKYIGDPSEQDLDSLKATAELLRARGVVEIEKIRIDLDPAHLDEMMQITGRRTVPQIFIGDHHVGGYDDLHALDSEGRLTVLLNNGQNA
jgi:glutaredoxin 3